jgi:hypothetical protein
MAREYAAARDAVVAYGRVYIWGDVRKVDDWYLAMAAYPASPIYISVPSRYAAYLPSFTQRLTRLYGVEFLPGELRKDIPIDWGGKMLDETLVRDVYSALQREVEELSSLSREDLLKVLPGDGCPGDHWDNPLSRLLASSAYLALGDNPSVLGVRVLPEVAECYAWEHELADRGELIATVELPQVLGDFVRRFNAGEYPNLILQYQD